MTLTEEEYEFYIIIHLKLLYFAGLKENEIPAKTTFDKFCSFGMVVKFKCRQAFYKNEVLLDEYIASNSDHLTDDELKVLNGFKRRISSNFVILKCLSKYAVFINTKDNRFYAVKALRDPFDSFFPGFPVYTTTTLIPFNDKIIYDGFFESPGVRLGRNITNSLNENYKKIKQQKLILTSLD